MLLRAHSSRITLGEVYPILQPTFLSFSLVAWRFKLKLTGFKEYVQMFRPPKL